MAMNSSKLFRCILCNENGSHSISLNKVFDTRFGIDEPYEVSECLKCGLQYTIPVLSAAELKHYYETYYNFGGERETAYSFLRERFLFSKIYQIWLYIDGDASFHKMKGFGRLLDIGCNEGRGLQIYRHKGFEVEGLELNQKAVSAARNKGFTVHSELLEKFQPDLPFDVVVLSNVLEHSLDPGNMLENVKRILRPNGEIWISCPNSQSWLRHLFGRSWINWHVPFHIVHFSSATLRNLLEKTGFHEIHIKQETPALWVSHSMIVCLFAKKGKPTSQLRNPLLIIFLMLIIRGLFFPLLWMGNILGKGDCLVATARKS